MKNARMTAPVNRRQLLQQILNLQPADLNNRKTLAKFYLQSVVAGVWPNNSQRDVLDYLAIAAKAVRDDSYGTPGALFWYLLTNNARDRISNEIEQSVLCKWSSKERFDLYESAHTNNNPQNTVHTRIPPLSHDSEYEQLNGYHHSFLLQCPFPQKPPPTNTEYWRSQHGRRIVVVRAGYTLSNGEIVSRPIPSGAIPRILVPYMFAQAIRYGRYVCMGRTLHEFIKTTGLSSGSKTYKTVSEQTINLACSTISLHEVIHGATEDDIYDTAIVPIASKHRLDPDALTIGPGESSADTSPAPSIGTRGKQRWDPHIIISDPLFNLITENPIPINIRHLSQLTRSPRRMDIYSWLSYRSFYLRNTVRIQISRLQPIFGCEIRCKRLFKHRLKQDLAEICAVRPFKVELDKECLVLRKSGRRSNR